MYEKISSGETLKFSVSISDVDGKLVDPTGLEFHLKKPNNTVQVYTYGSNIELKLDSTGKYYINLILDIAGTYLYKWKTLAPNISIKEGSVRVENVAF